MADLTVFDLRGERADIIKYPVLLLILRVGAESRVQDVIELWPARGGAIDRVVGVGAIEATSSREGFILDHMHVSGVVLGFAVVDAHN